MNVIKQLKCGAQKTFCFLNYSPSGELLASQSGESDYLLTIWNWSDERVVIRAQAHVNDVYKIIFSPYQTGLMSTCGRSHIKFWKMIDTFTGLKLKGEIGRFGNRDICDIIAAEILPDQTVYESDFLNSFNIILIFPTKIVIKILIDPLSIKSILISRIVNRC